MKFFLSINIQYFLKRLNYEKIHKINNIVLIFILTTVFLCQNLAYSAPNFYLRSNLAFGPDRKSDTADRFNEIVLNQAVIHFSKANTSKDLRIAITTGIKTKEAPMLFHYWHKEAPNEIEQFRQDDDFLIRFENFHQSIFRRPELGESMGKLPFTLKRPTKNDIDKLVRKAQKTWFSKFLSGSKI